MGQPFFIHQNINDFDEFCCVIKKWNLDYRQLETGLFSSELLMFGDDTTIFGRAKLGRKLQQNGAAPPGLITFCILANQECRINWRIHGITGDTLFVFPPDGELDSLTYDDFDVFPLSISEEILNQTCELLELPDIKTLINKNEIFQCDPKKLTELRSWLQSIYHQLMTGTIAIRNTHYLKQIERDLADRLVRILAEQHQPVRKKTLRKRDIALRAPPKYNGTNQADLKNYGRFRGLIRIEVYPAE